MEAVDHLPLPVDHGLLEERRYLPFLLLQALDDQLFVVGNNQPRVEVLRQPLVEEGTAAIPRF